jgi:hypothetical protein
LIAVGTGMVTHANGNAARDIGADDIDPTS